MAPTDCQTPVLRHDCTLAVQRPSRLAKAGALSSSSHPLNRLKSESTSLDHTQDTERAGTIKSRLELRIGRQIDLLAGTGVVGADFGIGGTISSMLDDTENRSRLEPRQCSQDVGRSITTRNPGQRGALPSVRLPRRRDVRVSLAHALKLLVALLAAVTSACVAMCQPGTETTSERTSSELYGCSIHQLLSRIWAKATLRIVAVAIVVVAVLISRTASAFRAPQLVVEDAGVFWLSQYTKGFGHPFLSRTLAMYM